MKVLLRSDVSGVGRRGDIVEVKAGFARNYLVPSGQAIAATDTMETQASWMRKSRDVADAKSREAAETQKGLIEAANLVIAARASANGRLFGSVTESDIVNAIRTATNISLDRHAIHGRPSQGSWFGHCERVTLRRSRRHRERGGRG